MKTLETEFDFRFHSIQVDNGYEFVNDVEKTNKKILFEQTAERLAMLSKEYALILLGKMEKLNAVIVKTTKYYIAWRFLRVYHN